MVKARVALCLGALAAALMVALPAKANERGDAARAPMIFGAANQFSQGFRAEVFAAAQKLPLRHYRDSLRWPAIEQQRGTYQFTGNRQTYPARLQERGHDLVLTVNWGNPLYDGGATPHSAEALDALAAYVAAVVSRYPAISAIEVGNEINGANFVSGSVLDAGLAARGAYHLAMVRAAHRGAKSVRPDIRILGGSTHSLPAGFLWPILDEGAQWLDGLALHPYTTPIDHLASQIGFLRRHPAAATMPIAITEWGSARRDKAPEDMLRGYATFAALGVQSLYWYPLYERGDGLVPLIARDGRISAAGHAFRLIQDTLGTRIARDLSPDAFTFVIAFDDDRLVMWGAPRDITLTRSDIEARDARGQMLSPASLTLAPDEPILLSSASPIALGSDVKLACSTLLADSFHQFSYGDDRDAQAGWVPALLRNGEALPLVQHPGQHRGGTPWNPYLGHAHINAIRLSADTLRTTRRAEDTYAIRFSFTAPHASKLRLDAQITARKDKTTAFAYQVETPRSAGLSEARAHRVQRETAIPVSSGDTIAVTIMPSPNERHAAVDYRLRLYDELACRETR